MVPNDGLCTAAVQRIDYKRSMPLPDGPVNRGYDYFFGTPNCPTTDPLYVYIDQDQVPVPATALLDKKKLPDHPFAWDNDVGMVAPIGNVAAADDGDEPTYKLASGFPTSATRVTVVAASTVKISGTVRGKVMP